MSVRLPAVAGTFYPAERGELLHEIGRGFAAARAAPAGTRPKAIIAPHAGYMFSGPVAATAYSHVRALRGTVQRVVLLGPSHRVAFRGLAVPSADLLATPLGDVRVDVAGREQIRGMPGVAVWDAPHSREHSLEVHLPFIIEVLGDVAVLPLVVGDAPAEQVAAVIDAVWGGDETLIVVSSDLSHYHSYQRAVVLDRSTATAIEEGRPADIGPDDACGVFPVRGLLVAARRRGLRARAVDLRNSGDTAGPHDHVVGYGAFVFGRGFPGDAHAVGNAGEVTDERPHAAGDDVQPGEVRDGWPGEVHGDPSDGTGDAGAPRVDQPEAAGPRNDALELSEQDRHTLLVLADASIRAGLEGRRPLVVDPADHSPALRSPLGVFVTVTVAGDLNGCIGNTWPAEPLCQAVTRLAWEAAFADPRLPQLRAADYPALGIEISVLTRPVLVSAATEDELIAQLRPAVDGLIIVDGRRRATFLPAVWDTLRDPREFVRQLKAKAGIPARGWSPTTLAYRYTATKFGTNSGILTT